MVISPKLIQLFYFISTLRSHLRAYPKSNLLEKNIRNSKIRHDSGTQKKELSISESLAKKIWPVVEPILQKRKKGVGRPKFDRYKVFFGILYILESGAKWRLICNSELTLFRMT